MSFADYHRVENVNLGVVNQEGFEEDSDDEGCFFQHEECSIDPCRAGPVEDGEQGNLWQVEGQEKQRCDTKREYCKGKQSGTEEGPQVSMADEMDEPFDRIKPSQRYVLVEGRAKAGQGCRRVRSRRLLRCVVCHYDR